jgi:Brp/Blh family beta-carotene 15,15'-monooxygenase
MLLCVVSYLINSFAAILFFILISSYHFGEQHLEGKLSGAKSFKTVLYVAYGVLIFSLIFIENLHQVDEVMLNLTGSTIPEIWIKSILVSSASLLIILFGFHLLRKGETKIKIIREFFYLILLYLVFNSSSLILGFAIYFVLWHSIPSILDQTKFLSGQQTFKTIIHYLKTAFIYWIISIAGLMIAYYYLSENYFNSIIFLALFAVTAPHVWVMNRMKQSKSSSNNI